MHGDRKQIQGYVNWDRRIRRRDHGMEENSYDRRKTSRTVDATDDFERQPQPVCEEGEMGHGEEGGHADRREGICSARRIRDCSALKPTQNRLTVS
jgi:hypothetical protein